MNLDSENQIDSFSYNLDVEGLIKQKFLEPKFSNIKINLYEAFAGCGKTQHLKEIVKKNVEQGKNNFLFLAFNKSIRLEFIEDVKYPYFNRRNTHTFHSFACSFLNRAERETFKDQEDQQEFFKSLINDFRCADFQNNELSNKYDIIIVDEVSGFI